MEYRRLPGTDILFKRDPKSDKWVPVEEGEGNAIIPHEPDKGYPLPTAQLPPEPQQSSSILAAFRTLGQALDGQFYAGSHTDRGKGFVIRTSILSLLGLCSGIYYAIVVKEAPILSMTLFASIMVGLVLAWLIAYILDSLTAPETITLLLALGLLGWLRQERKERWRRYDDR